MSLVFKTLTESLTWQQMCYLKAILNGETVISTSDVLHRYGISSATSASRSKAALIARNIIAVKEGKVVFLDPIYSYWLKTRYFK
jgi:endo-1,4-beta-mannosidase